MNPNWTTRNGRMMRKGLFVHGIWHCDCDARLPAEKFQVKNGGKNHGRWFYTCQKPQPKRCSFFLWSDDAKIREEGALLSNSKSEPNAQEMNPPEGRGYAEEHWKPEEAIIEPKPPRTPKTPMRQAKITEPITPVSNMKRLQRTPTPPQIARSQTLSPGSDAAKHDESFDWSSSAEDELAEFADTLEADALDTDDTSPRKSAKMSKDDSPSKRKQDNPSQRAESSTHTSASDLSSTWLLSSDDFPATPSRQNGPSSGLLSPKITPVSHHHPQNSINSVQQAGPNTKETVANETAADEPQDPPSALALDALTILSPVRSSLSPNTERALVNLLNRHDLRTQGIFKGREIARIAIQNKDKKITELQQRIASLEAERDTSRVVIQHLKSDIATSPKKPRWSRDGGGGPGGGSFRRSDS